jgi:hypothetical protein
MLGPKFGSAWLILSYIVVKKVWLLLTQGNTKYGKEK